MTKPLASPEGSASRERQFTTVRLDACNEVSLIEVVEVVGVVVNAGEEEIRPFKSSNEHNFAGWICERVIVVSPPPSKRGVKPEMSHGKTHSLSLDLIVVMDVDQRATRSTFLRIIIMRYVRANSDAPVFKEASIKAFNINFETIFVNYLDPSIIIP